MTETEISPATTSEAPTAAASAEEKMTSKKTPAAGKKANAKKPVRVRPNHPPAAEMVNAAIVALKDKHGSSLQAIKKYISATYSVDADKQATFIRKYLKTAVAKKSIVQVKGSGASGSFRLATEADKKPAVSAVATAAVKKTKKQPVVKKPTAVRKPAVQKRTKKIVKKAATVASAKAIKPSGTTSKAKTGGKAPGAAKPRTPKPKKSANAAAKAKVVK